MNFKISLDKYLTSYPENALDNYCEDVENKFTDDFYNQNEQWIIEGDLCSKWIQYLFRRGKSPIEAAIIIQRAFKIYKP